jgi:hypothetical protein
VLVLDCGFIGGWVTLMFVSVYGVVLLFGVLECMAYHLEGKI